MISMIFTREMKLFVRDKIFFVGAVIGYIIVGLFFGCVFYKVTSLESKVTIYGFMLFYLVAMVLLPVAEFGSVLTQSKVLAKQLQGSIY